MIEGFPAQPSLNVDLLHEMQRRIAETFAVPAHMLVERRPAPVWGWKIFFSPYALRATEERLFPASKHRSRRIHKKLVKRYGSEFRMKPVMWIHGASTIIAHPSFREELRQAGFL